jgi:peptidoglycan/LPS O-acetylase OafA/YrhL
MSGAGIDRQAGSAVGERGLPHITGLDGVRGLAALAVVLYHAGVSWLPAGFLGVDVFFVVSGFLITALLVSERERSSETDLAQFWLRRARRLLPVLVLVLIVTTVYAAIMLQGTLGQHLHDVLMAAVYFTNWDLILRGVSYFEMFERPSQLRHLWSLAVEEQFYIVWPVLFALVMRFLNLRWLWCIIVAFAVISVLWMIVLFTPGADPSRVYFGSDPRAFTILIGVAVGLIWKPWRFSWGTSFGVMMDVIALLGLAMIVVIMAIGRHWSEWMYPWGLLAISMGAIVLVAFVGRPGSMVGRALEIAPLRWLGQRSYSIYLWHWPVMLALQWEFNFIPNTITIVVAALLATFILSELSYRLVEAPMRRPQFWTAGRFRVMFANPRAIAAVLASSSLAVLLALVVGLLIMPGRSPSDLLYTASAEQSAQSDSISAVSASDPAETNATVRHVITREAKQRFVSPPAASEHDAAAAEFNRSAASSGQISAPADSGSQSAFPQSDRQPEPETRSQSAIAQNQYPPGEYFARYTVEPGNSPYGLINRFKMTREQFISLNGDKAMHIIHPGDALTVPCPGTAPCAFVRVEQVGDGCLSWQIRNETERICRSSTFLVELPIHFTAEPDGPLDALPTWSWGEGSGKEGFDFTLLLDHVDEHSPEPSVLTLKFGLPPLAIGDSVMVGAQPYLEDVGIEVDAKVGRLAHTAISILTDDIARNGARDTVVFHAVGASFLDARGFHKLLEAAAGVRHLIVLTRQFPPREPLLSLERDTNKMLRQEAAKYDWVTLVDWNQITNGREQEVTWDGTHLNSLGRQLYADQILAAIMSQPPPQFAQFEDLARPGGR